MTEFEAKKVYLKDSEGDYVVPVAYSATYSNKGSELLDYHNITNCIVEVPRNLIIETNNDSVVLKAGSKVTYPDGFEQDGTTPKFSVITTTSDITLSYPSAPLRDAFIWLDNTGGAPRHRSSMSEATSGTTAPSGSSLWYDTTTNTVKYYNNGSLTYNNCSLPICILNTENHITQFFNHMGFIGTASFFLPGIKILKANGRNNDGTLKNDIITIDKPTISVGGGMSGTLDYIRTSTSGGISLIRDSRYFQVDTYAKLPSTDSSLNLAFVRDENQWYQHYVNGGITEWTLTNRMVLNCTVNINEEPQYIYNINNMPQPLSIADKNEVADRDLSNLNLAGEAHFSNPDLSNLSSTGINKLPSNFMATNTNLYFSSSASIGTYDATANVSSLLPSDTNNYLLLLNVRGNQPDGATTTGLLHLLSGLVTHNTTSSYANMIVSSANVYSANTFLFPVDSSRTLTVTVVHGAIDNLYVRCYGYIRLGNN